MAPNTLYYGNNLDILRRYLGDETVDLVYLDPPFNSNANYNVLFAEKDGSQAASQIRAFDDTWHWTLDSARQFEEIVEQGGKVAEALQAFRHLLGTNDMLAYLTTMAPRLVELRRVLKPTGSLYLHCDPTASHYLKVLLPDADRLLVAVPAVWTAWFGLECLLLSLAYNGLAQLWGGVRFSDTVDGGPPQGVPTARVSPPVRALVVFEASWRDLSPRAAVEGAKGCAWWLSACLPAGCLLLALVPLMLLLPPWALFHLGARLVGGLAVEVR